MIDRRRFLLLSTGVAAAAAGLTGCSSRTVPSTAEDSAVLEMSFAAAPTEIDLGGVTVQTWAYGGAVPGPEVRLRRGQTLRAALTNDLPADTTLHWHGLAIPNAMDGVPVLTQPAVAPGQNFGYEFVVPDAGTYWYHSHVGTQLDRGLFGPLIIEEPVDGADYDAELVVVLDDWIDGTGRTPEQVLADLRRTGMADMGPGAGVAPSTPMGDDGGDVIYPYYTANGRISTDPQVLDYRGGQRVRLRIINAGSDTTFQVGIPNHRMTVTHTDGFPVEPQDTDAVILGMGERVDAIVTLTSTAPLVAAAYRKDGFAQLSMRVNGASTSGAVDAFVTTLRGRPPLDTATLVAAPAVDLPPAKPEQTLELRLGGPGNRYDWTINDKSYDPPGGGYAVQPNRRVRVRYVNETKMLHPMHLHGHTFQVMGARGPRARKDTVLVSPLQTVEVDLETDNPGRWITHCHNTYHLESGMAAFLYYS